jgi:hypothetical protein
VFNAGFEEDGLLDGLVHVYALHRGTRDKLAQDPRPREPCRAKGPGAVTRRVAFVLGAASLLAACARTPERPADLIVYGRVWTGDTARPWVAGVALRGDTIVAAGSTRHVNRFRGPSTRVLDGGDRSVLPGFGDSHTHFVDGGFQLMSVDLRDAASPAEFTRRIAEFARRLPKGRWITGGDWDHENWPGAPLPRREWIDSVTPDHPVFVSRLDGHMGIANSAALRLARITRASRAPEGGEIIRDPATGELTGLLKDNAMDPIWHGGDRYRAGCRAPPRGREWSHHHPLGGRLGRLRGVQAGACPERPDGARLCVRADLHVEDARGHGARRGPR